jgi:hypothetical protein
MPDRNVSDDLVRRLYEAPPDGFVAARSAAIADARRAGDKQAARRLGELRKPTVAAWLVNLLALRRPDLLDELTELAASLRAAQRELHGDQLRELSTRRRQAVSALVAEARRLATEADPTVSAGKLPLAEVETTLTAALADADVAEQVRSGRLIRAATYAGFGEVPRPRLRLVTADDTTDGDATDDEATVGDAIDGDATVGDAIDGDSAGGVGSAGSEPVVRIGRRPAEPGVEGRRATEPDRAPSNRGSQAEPAQQRAAEQRAAEQRAATRRAALAQRRRELKQQLTAARAAETRAHKNLHQAETAERDAVHAVAEIEAALAELERRRAAAQADVSQRKLARRAAQRDATTARRRVGDVQAALEDVEDDLQASP